MIIFINMSSIKSTQLELAELKEANKFLTKQKEEKISEIHLLRTLYINQVKSKIMLEKISENYFERLNILTERNQENIQVQRKLKTEIENLERDAYFFKKFQEYLQEKNSELNRKLFKLEQRQKLTNDADFDDVKVK